MGRNRLHRRRPDFFQLYPSLNHTEGTTPSGEHVLRIESFSTNEFFTIQFLSYLHPPEFLYIRSTAGYMLHQCHGWLYRKYPLWVYRVLWLLVVAGADSCVYWLIRSGIFVVKGLGVL